MEINDLMAAAGQIVLRRGRRAGLSPEDCEDLTQDILMRYRQVWAARDPENPAAWIETATANAIIDRFRAEGRRPADNFAVGEDDPIALLVAVKGAQFASAPAVRQELMNSVLVLISEDEASLITRRYVDGVSAAALADELGIPAATVDQRCTRAKRRLREALEGRPDLIEELRAPHPQVYPKAEQLGRNVNRR